MRTKPSWTRDPLRKLYGEGQRTSTTATYADRIYVREKDPQDRLGWEGRKKRFRKKICRGKSLAITAEASRGERYLGKKLYRTPGKFWGGGKKTKTTPLVPRWLW